MEDLFTRHLHHPSARDQAAAARDLAIADRARAAEDRAAAARDRRQAAAERTAALADRDALVRQLALAETDPLTGARTRAAGLGDLDHELDRCRRTSTLLVVAYVDVVGLKTVNDTEGHAAGDALLKRVVSVITAHLRSYDLVVRLGGDEFLCAMPNMNANDARERFSQVAVALAAARPAAAIRTGFGELKPDDSATDLIARADHELVGRDH